jgi:hypothetical protein
MEDRRDHRVRRLVILSVVLLAVSGEATAQEQESGPFEPWPSTVSVSTNPNAVVVESQGGGTAPGGTGTQASGGGSNCWVEGPGNIGMASVDLVSQEPNLLPYTLICDGEAVGVVWLPIDGGGGPVAPAFSPREIALSLRDRIPIPSVTIEINPERGLVGVESWFWIEGYDGEPITESTDGFGSRVDVEARVQRYEWSFGDGKRMRTENPGRPYPERSDVRHMYERSSLGHEGGYPVEVGFFFSVRYRVDGRGWIDLPGIERVAEARYPVRESQAVIRE